VYVGGGGGGAVVAINTGSKKENILFNY